MKVKIMQRSVYHKYAEIEIELPKEITDIKINKCYNTYGEFNIQEYLLDNENLWINKMENKISKAPFDFGNGMETYDWTDRNEESEWMYMGEDGIGGHL